METNGSSSYVFITILVGAFVIFFSFVRSFNEWFYVKPLGKKQYQLPPGDMGWPLVGTMVSYLKSVTFRKPDSFISSFVSRYGGMGIYRTVMFGKPSIILCTSDMCRRALSDEDNFKMSYPLGIRGIVGPKSFHELSKAERMHYRRLTTSVINGNETLSRYIKHIEEVMTASLEKWSDEGRSVQFATEVKKTVFEAILPFLCGSLADNIAERTLKLLGEVNDGMGLLNINFPGFKFRKALKAREELTEVLKELLDATRSAKGHISSGEGMSIMDVLLSGKNEDGEPISEEIILDQIHMFLFVSFPSVTAVLTLVMWYLHENPDMLVKAKAEQLRILKGRDPAQKGLSLREIKQMDFLAKVIDETLRTSMPMLFREATTDVIINGYLIPKGWKVLVWIRAVHMDPKNYADPEEFNPSRWEDHDKKGGTFLPFGAGSRVCPGSDFAKLEICIFLHHFLLNYEVEQVNPGCPINYVTMPCPSDKFLARFRKTNVSASTTKK